MSIKEIQERHDCDSIVWELAIEETSLEECEGDEWYETHKDRGELLDALKEIGALLNDPDCKVFARVTPIKAILDKP